MNTFLFVFVIALVLSTTLVVFLIYSGFRQVFIREKHSLRDAHSKGIPRSGGIGIVLGFLITIALAYGLIERLPNSPNNPFASGLQGPLVIFLIGGLVIFLVGLADDIWNIRIRYKLLGQLAVAFLLNAYGFQIDQIDLPVYGTQSLGVLAVPLTILWMLGVMNAINLIDGLDGLASGIVIIALGGLLTITYLQGNFIIVVFCLALIGSILGFWLFNRHPASIFMGDSGSLFLGYSLATLCLWAMKHPTTGAVSLLPVILLGIPILDTLFSLFRRYLKGIPFYSADRDHMHHRLLNKGYTAPQAVRMLYLFAIGFAGLTLVFYWKPDWYLMICLAALLFGYFVLFFLEYKEIKAPFQTMKETASLKKQRSFIQSLSENIDLFFSKDTSMEELLKSFAFWASQIKIDSYSIKVGTEFLVKYQATLSLEKKPYRQLIYEQGSLQVILNFDADELSLDSDIKGRMMDQVIEALSKNIHRLHQHPAPLPSESLPLHRKETTQAIDQ